MKGQIKAVKGEKSTRGGCRKGAGRKPISNRMRPFLFGSLSTAPVASGRRCSGQALHCRSKVNPRENVIFLRYCDSWDCPRCRRILEARWADHIRAKSVSTDDKGDYCLLAAVFTTSLDEWTKSVRKYLQRHGADYVRMRLRGGEVAVINNWGEGSLLYSGRFAPEMEGQVQPFDAGLEAIFAVLDCKCRPISTSANWRLTAIEREPQWELVHLLTGQALNEAVRKLQKWGVPHTITTKADKTTIRFEWSTQLEPGEIAYYELMLAPITPR